MGIETHLGMTERDIEKQREDKEVKQTEEQQD
jgi:hypothetical protein